MVIGRVLSNRYEILEKIGGGGMSLVYRAKDIYLNRIVAVKVLREQFTSDDEFVGRFRREAQAVASLSHGNIVSIYDVGQEIDIYYLVMEMVDGRNLKELIKERGPLPVKEVVDIAKQICDALEHAHDHKIIHRDIKPHNIIITKNGRAKVTDFGIARAVSTATVTHTGSIMGSVHYFSPEQAKGEIADEKSDIYSLGVVLYELLTGILPFQGDSPISVALKKIHGDPLSPRQINTEISEALEAVILKAMAREPFYRYQSVHQLKQDLISAYLYNKIEHEDGQKLPVTEDTINLPRLSRTKEKDLDISAPVKVWTWVMVALIILGFVMGMYLSASVLARGEVTVPDVSEKNIEEGRNELTQMGLKLEVDRYTNHPRINVNTIISQNPKAQQIVKKNSVVEVIVSLGPSLVKVPNIINSSLLSAEVSLSNEGLDVGEITRVYNNQIPSGQVIHQEPAGGEEVVQGSGVNLIVSRGSEPIWINMPDLSTLPLSEAKGILENYDLLLGVVQPERSQKYSREVVIRQDPGAGSEILQGSTVNLVVSSGPGPTGEQAFVKIESLPNSGNVKIIVDDTLGRHVAYNQYHFSGDTVEEQIDYVGSGYIEVFVNEILIERKAVE